MLIEVVEHTNKDFMAAVERGTRDLERDPNAGLRGLLEANPDLDPRLQRAVVDVTLPLFKAPAGKPFGWQEPGDWRAFEAWMREQGLLRGAEPATGPAFTNELLRGRGL